MNKFYKVLLSAIVVGFTLTSCTKTEVQPKGEFENGTFVSNEGAFTKSNASVSFIDSKGNVQQGIFKATNGRDLGDVLQSMTIADEKAYLVVNNSNKIEIVDAYTFKEDGVISDLQKPRYIIKVKNKLYVTQHGNNSVAVLDANSLNTLSTVPVGASPEGLLEANNDVWVANGGWGYGTSVSVINTDDNTESKVQLGADFPIQMVEDAEGDVWVLCSGKVIYDVNWAPIGHTPSKLVEVDASSKSIKKTIELSVTKHYNKLAISNDGKSIYYTGGMGSEGIFKLSTSDNSAPSSAFITGSFNGLSLDGKYIYSTIAPDYVSNGSMKKYDTTGKEVATYEVNIAPNGVVFN